MSDRSSVDLRSNLMVDDEQHSPKHTYIPGDFLRLIRPWLFDRRIQKDTLTPTQVIEYEQYLVCNICERTCAGTCGGRHRQRR